MALNYPSPIIFSAPQTQSASVIMLHGLGDTGSGWADIAPQFQEGLPNVKFIFPTAPQRSITLNMGMRMTGWYDISSLESVDHEEDSRGLTESMRYVESLVAKEVEAGTPSDRIVVAGFSQGGAIALMMLRSEHKLAGIVGLSTYLPLADKPPVVSEQNKGTPVLMCHGTADPVIRYEYGKQSVEKLEQAGLDVDFKSYAGMGHSACPSELGAIMEFLKSRLA